MKLPELLRIAADHAPAPLVDAVRRYRRYRALRRISALYRNRDNYHELVRASLEAMRLIDLELAKAQHALRRMP